MLWATEMLRKVYGPAPSIRVQHCTDQIGLAYYCLIRDQYCGNHVMIFMNAQSLVRWCDDLRYRVGDRVRLSDTGVHKAPHMAYAEGVVTWVAKTQVFTVELHDAARHRSLTLMLYASDLTPVVLN